MSYIYSMDNRLYKVIITQDPDDGRFIAEVPTLEPCLTWGDTVEEALEMAKEAIEGVIETRLANGYPVADDSETLRQESAKTTLQVVLPVSYTGLATRLSA